MNINELFMIVEEVEAVSYLPFSFDCFGILL